MCGRAVNERLQSSRRYPDLFLSRQDLASIRGGQISLAWSDVNSTSKYQGGMLSRFLSYFAVFKSILCDLGNTEGRTGRLDGRK